MKRLFYHPLWTHLPAVALLAATIYKYVSVLPLPHVAPTHFGIRGQADGWGPPVVTFYITLGVGVLMLAISVLLDELWARQEKQKRFNWLAPFDEVIIGLLTGLSLNYYTLVATGGTVLPPSAIFDPVIIGGALGCAILLEWARPFTPAPTHLHHEDTRMLEAEIAARAGNGVRWAYLETQNPWWMTLLVLLISAALIAGGVISWSQLPLSSVITFVIAAFLWLFYGGLRVMVTSEGITARLGIIGIRLKHIPWTDLVSSELREFSPLREFGGYGIRYNREMTGIFFAGTRGVLLSFREGRPLLLGSDTPERLAAVIAAAQRK